MLDCFIIVPNCKTPPGLHPVVVLQYLCAWCLTPWIDVITGTTGDLQLQMLALKSAGLPLS